MHPSPLKLCRVCGSHTDHARMGVLACRACASFFKRTVASSRMFICRQGDSSCDVERHTKFLCRCCRYQKCVKLGMRIHEYRPCKMLLSLLPAVLLRCCFKESARSISKRRLMSRVVEMKNPSLHYACSLTGPSDEKIREMKRQFRTFFNRRKQREIARHGILHEVVTVPTTSTDLVMYTRNFAESIIRASGKEFFLFASKAFSAFRMLILTEKKLLLRTFWGRMGIMECYHYTLRYFPDNDPPRYIVSSRTTCMDIDNFEFFFADAPDIKNKKRAAETMRGYELKMIAIAWSMFKRTRLTDEELHATVGLMLFEFDDEFPESLEAICLQVSTQIYRDLGEYYKRTFTPEECAVRLGNLITLIHVVKESNWLMQEEFQVYSLLDLIESDTYLVDLFLDFSI